MLKLVVIGDSIAKGYGSTDASVDSFGAILGEKLDAEVVNLGIVGLDSSQLQEKLQTEKFQSAITDADVICISIGSNDLLKPFLADFAESVEVTGEEKELYEKIQKQLSSTAKKNPLKAADMLATAMKKLTNSETLYQACDDFPAKFEGIITEIKTQNPNVIIYANNIYNPYYGVAYDLEGISLLNVHQLCEPYINRLNKAFDSNTEAYTMMDMYSIFRQEGYTHVEAGSLTDINGINFDPHPNDAGYRLMADYIYTKLDSTIPQVISCKVLGELEEGLVEEATATEISEAGISCEGIAGFRLMFSERVRFFEGEKFVLQSEEDVFEYVISETVWIEKNEDGNIELILNLEGFQSAEGSVHDTIQPDTEYTLKALDGSVKDKGNNHLEEVIHVFKTAKEETVAEVSSNSVYGFQGTAGKVKMGMLSVGLFLLIGIVVVFMQLNKKR